MGGLMRHILGKFEMRFGGTLGGEKGRMLRACQGGQMVETKHLDNKTGEKDDPLTQRRSGQEKRNEESSIRNGKTQADVRRRSKWEEHLLTLHHRGVIILKTPRINKKEQRP